MSTKDIQEIDQIDPDTALTIEQSFRVPDQRATFQELLTDGVTSIGELTGQSTKVDKGQLEGVPFIIKEYRFLEGFNQEYAWVHAITQNNEDVSFTDGGIGIVPVLKAHREQGRTTAIYCPRGLRQSTYEYGNTTATTWYFA